MMWVDRTGAAQPIAAAGPGSYLGPRLSPDGQKIAVARRRERSRTTDVWVYDVERGAPTRVTFEAVRFRSGRPTAGASHGTLKSSAPMAAEAPSASRPARRCSSPRHGRPKRTRSCTCRKRPPEQTAFGSFRCRAERKPQLFIESRFQLWHPDLSPDGRWMAYVSNESGTEVYVQPYRGPAKRFASRLRAEWIRSGARRARAAYRRSRPTGSSYFSPLPSARLRRFEQVRQADVSGEGVASTTPRRLSEAGMCRADGKRFLLVKPGPLTDKPVTAMHVVLNWTEELKRLAK